MGERSAVGLEPGLEDDYPLFSGDIDRLLAGLMVRPSHLQYLQVLAACTHLLGEHQKYYPVDGIGDLRWVHLSRVDLSSDDRGGIPVLQAVGQVEQELTIVPLHHATYDRDRVDDDALWDDFGDLLFDH